MSDESTSGNNAYIFITKDSDGKKVVLKHATFSDKIIKSHPEITPALIKEGIEYAHIIIPDSSYDNRWNYYKYVLSPIEGRNNLTNLKVVVEETTGEYGEIVTAYLPSKMKNEVCRGDIRYDAGSASKS